MICCNPTSGVLFMLYLLSDISFDSEQKKKVTNRLISDADHILNVVLCERKVI